MLNRLEGYSPVVLIALPANEVSTRWFRAKLLPTDCSPIFPKDELQSFKNMIPYRRNNFHRLDINLSNDMG